MQEKGFYVIRRIALPPVLDRATVACEYTDRDARWPAAIMGGLRCLIAFCHKRAGDVVVR